MIEGFQNFLSAFNAAVLSGRLALFPVCRNVCSCAVQDSAVLSEASMCDEWDPLCPPP